MRRNTFPSWRVSAWLFVQLSVAVSCEASEKISCSVPSSAKSPAWKTPDHRFVASAAGCIGLAGYFNINQVFVPGELSLGVTPSIDVRIDRYFHAGAECMLLWGKPDTTEPTRFIINANLRLRVSVPVHPRVKVEAMIIGGASYWPKADTVSAIEPSFYKDRFGWNTQPALGIEYLINRRWSIAATAGYIANTTVLDEIAITQDMMLVTLGPRLRF